MGTITDPVADMLARIRNANTAFAERVDIPECEAVLSEILYQTSTSEGGTRMCYNMYDVRLRDRRQEERQSKTGA